MFEPQHKPLAPVKVYHKRLLRYGFYALLMLSASLGLGMFGYHSFANLNWVDALLNASMILTGMGPVDRMESDAGKLFASFYAIFSGVAFLTTSAVLLAPVIHRFLHKLHVDEKDF
ncbi:hypothetical protein [Solitalea koreensis]|uniref:Ion channel n=1 Tax=Solitalea koreensis TaxID=543615 RepID=A0A521BXN8_9SPHI|nr:hypothetical protein [Solitalea koreensis]SMO51947.1 hypothetical protein SAMN06265350_10312 [Solitalea koreensis]